MIHGLLSRRDVGSAHLAVISAGSFDFTPREYSPPAGSRSSLGTGPSMETVRAGLCSLYVETDGVRVIIDPVQFGEDEDVPLANLVATPGLDAGLEALGTDPMSIDYVLLTHGHFDHCSGVLQGANSSRVRFPNATHVLRVEDWAEGGLSEEWRRPLLNYLKPVEEAGLLRIIGSHSYEVSERLILIHAPGETPGHCVVQIAEGAAYYLGDLVHIPAESKWIGWAAGSHDRDLGKMIDSRRMFLRQVAETRAVCVFTHAPFPGWGMFRSVADDQWQWDPVVEGGKPPSGGITRGQEFA
jgi:glyoxylase-like metal-dependent hydrolase (beta-lactamase superfamily II)